MNTLELKIHIDVADKVPFVINENISTGKLFGEPVELNREIHGNLHYMNWQGKTYSFKLTDIVSAIGAEVKSNGK